MPDIKLYCFPYAGGSAMIFNKWRRLLDPGTELVPVELAGRGTRIQETLYRDLNHAVDDVFSIMRDQIRYSAYALFGHSMGSLICYELAQRIRQEHLPPPLHIFFSGGKAPHVKRDDEKKFHLMEVERFKKEIIGLGGTPPEFFEHPPLMDLFLPLLKNDFRIAETDLHDRRIVPFEKDISVLLGKEDDLNAEQCDGWKKHTTQRCTLYYFNGGHFFLHDSGEEVVSLINSVLRNVHGASLPYIGRMSHKESR